MIDAFLKVSDAGSRRDLFRSVGLIALGGGSAAVFAACSGNAGDSGSGSGSGGSTGGAPSAGGSSADAPSSSGSSAGGSSAGGSSADLTLAKADVPKGSGVIKSDYIVTQPTAGTFKAFSNKCTHQGCPITQIKGDTITCNCHGSEFGVDGSVKRGPANRPLTAAKVSVDGDKLDVSA